MIDKGETPPIDLIDQTIYYAGPCPAKPGHAVVDSMKKNDCFYFAAIGGAGALLAEAVKEAEVAAFPDLGPEAIYKLTVENFPVTVVIDNRGNNLYETGKEKYRR